MAEKLAFTTRKPKPLPETGVVLPPISKPMNELLPPPAFGSVPLKQFFRCCQKSRTFNTDHMGNGTTEWHPAILGTTVPITCPGSPAVTV